jgi:hypothetical protein
MSASENRRLLRAWAILVVLTAVPVAGTLVWGGTGSSGPIAVLVALAASFVKARQVLDHFLDLRRSGPGWRGFFTALLLLILGGALACHLWGRFLGEATLP